MILYDQAIAVASFVARRQEKWYNVKLEHYSYQKMFTGRLARVRSWGVFFNSKLHKMPEGTFEERRTKVIAVIAAILDRAMNVYAAT